jgi:menaquinone-specific isochorismate synthase
VETRRFQPDIATFEKVFLRVKEKIFSGELRKAVPFVVWRSAGAPTEDEIQSWVSRAYARSDLGKPYAFLKGDRGSVGVTPELLFELHRSEGWLKTVALAGTVASPSAWNSKLKEEHELVVQGLLERMHGEQVERGSFEFVRYGSLWHGRTELVARDLTDVRPDAWVARLHPTAAIGVLPVVPPVWPDVVGPEALEFMGERGAFGSPFLEADGDVVRAWVQIRGLEWDSRGVSVTCGVGVTAESELEDEKAEAFLKFKNIAAVLGLNANA